MLLLTRNLPFLHRQNSCFVVWQQLSCWLVSLPSLSMLLIGCPWFTNTGRQYARGAGYISSYVLCGVSLLTLTAISVDRLLALLLGIKYRQIVTLKRTRIITATYQYPVLHKKITFLSSKIVEHMSSSLEGLSVPIEMRFWIEFINQMETFVVHIIGYSLIDGRHSKERIIRVVI